MQGEKIMNNEGVVKKYDSEDYCEMIVCLKKHQLAIKFVLRKI